MNPLNSLWNKVAGTKIDAWYEPKSVTGAFIDGLVNAVTAEGFSFRCSGFSNSKIKGIKHKGRFGVYGKQTDQFSWSEVRIFSGQHAPAVGVSVGYDVTHGKWIGWPKLRIGIGHYTNTWQHVGATTDIYTPKRVPTAPYNPGPSASQVLEKVGVRGLEARVN